MSTKNDVLSVLERERNRYISGQELAETLKISRTAIWKAVKALVEDGHKIAAINNKGYKLETGSNVLSEEGVRVSLPDELKQCQIKVFSIVDSTNTQAKKLVMEKASHGTIILAEEQTAGRGRYGKSFFSPRGVGLYMSVVLKPSLGMPEPQMITIATAVAVCSAIEKLTDKKPQIKWVNDIYLDGKKICGILTEAVTDFESGSIESIVVGVGVDCTTEDAIIPEELRDIIGSLGVQELSRNQLAAEIASGILSGFENLGSREIIEEYRKRSLMLGREITFIRGNEKLSAMVTGINDSGSLLVRLASGEDLSLSSGEVTIGSILKQ
ncbi:MAG: biotin--[acetyl-CoA-carboxylase] ligase [Oscillospiraceae bacterium]|nr:biotin--[acetyl-CoA-carboxylase] ligase [Oscillospiraceae bacterium]